MLFVYLTWNVQLICPWHFSKHLHEDMHRWRGIESFGSTCKVQHQHLHTHTHTRNLCLLGICLIQGRCIDRVQVSRPRGQYEPWIGPKLNGKLELMAPASQIVKCTKRYWNHWWSSSIFSQVNIESWFGQETSQHRYKAIQGHLVLLLSAAASLMPWSCDT